MIVGVIGLGTIGIKLTEYLAEKGFTVKAYNWRNIAEKQIRFNNNIEKKVKYEKVGLDFLDVLKAEYALLIT